MVRGFDEQRNDKHTWKLTNGNRRNFRLSLTLVFLMITSVAAPSLSSVSSTLEPTSERYFTANGTLDDTSTTTLLSNLNTSNPIEVTGVMDDQQRVHLVWIENGTMPQLHYALIATSGVDTVLIASTPVGQNSTSALSSPSLVIDSEYKAHIVWAITDTHILYALLNPALDNQDGSPGDITNMSLVSTHIIADGTGVRNDPDIAIDSFDAAHVVWVDTYDAQGTFFGAPLIYYAMLAWNASGSNALSTQINNTIITPAIGYKGNPAVSMGTNNTVVIVWEDTRGSLIEYVGLIDSSGSMTTEWIDMCAVFYGGNLSSGEFFQGVKPLLEAASITVLETLYALSGQMSFANSEKNCEDAYEVGGYGDGPRSNHLGQNSTDTSGGIRALSDVMYNGSSLNIPTDWSYNSEMWGPGSTWACLSWRDNAGNVPGNPATTYDHQWNPNATRLIVPVSDEGPYGGSGSGANQQSQGPDDYQSISEAHDACAKAGIIPVPIAGTTSYGASTIWGNDTHVRSHMMDLAQCPDSVTGTHQRTCDDTTWATTDAGGEMYLFPSNNMANFEGDFESGHLTNGWGVSGSSIAPVQPWSVEDANNGIVYSSTNLCGIGGSTNSPAFSAVTCNYTHPANETVEIFVTVDVWPNEFSMDIILPNGTVDAFNSSDVYSGFSGVLATYTTAGNYTIYLNDSYGDGGTSASADCCSYVSATNPSSTPITGIYSAQSGDISDGDNANLEFTGMLAAGTVSFSYNVSSESNYDFLRFFIDGVQLAQWSGAQDGNFSTPVSLGQHTLKWVYVKDGSLSSGSDAAWIDDVVVPIANYTQELNALVNEIIGLTSGSGSTETFLTVLNPYSILNNPRSSWTRGMSAHTIDDSGQYVEDIGPAVDYVWQDGTGWGTIGHFVLANDTRLTSGHGWSVNPDVNVDDDGNVHVVWVDGRDTMPSRDAPSQLHYMQLDLDRAGVLDGEANGLNLAEVAVVVDSAVQGSDMTFGANPRVDFDNDGSVHITWFESMEGESDEDNRVELRWTRINVPQLNDQGVLRIGKSLIESYAIINTRIIASSSNNLMGIFGSNLESSSQPIVNFDWPNRDIVWTADECSDTETVTEDQWEVCMWSENVWNVGINFASGLDETIELQPSQSINIDLLVEAIKISGTSDIASITVSGAPNYWFVDAGFAGNYQHTTTLVEGQTSELDLFLRAPTLAQVNDDQTFWLTLTLTSSTKEEGTISKLLLIDLVNEGDWNDDDNDGIPDAEDDCQFGDSGWTSAELTDHDGDGCRDSSEDDDDDNDGIYDESDGCSTGVIGEIIDADYDGCDDILEDYDTDGDGVLNEFDYCPNGAQYWGELSVDHDGDGCRDADEDDNDDNDPYLDLNDDCSSGATWWTDLFFDHDSDGCHDVFDDDDDDNDGVLDVDDGCPHGVILWLSDAASDQDGDGCLDSIEDDDRDNDGILDVDDDCSMGMSDWSSTILNDWDSDGCNDVSEDSDDDNDGFSDSKDHCQRSVMNPEDTTDLDNDGCYDFVEDTDLDNDGIESSIDNCEQNPTSGWISTITEDADRDGCHDSTEDADDDGDGILDGYDNCLGGNIVFNDLDQDGCDDETQDLDDDGDGIPDSRDKCPTGITNWNSNKKNDMDRDGCMDATEDSNVQMSMIQLLTSNSVITAGIVSMTVILLAALVLVQRKRPVVRGAQDHTARVESMIDEDWDTERQPVEKKIEDLTDIGYSPEVARAILENEERVRDSEF